MLLTIHYYLGITIGRYISTVCRCHPLICYCCLHSYIFLSFIRDYGNLFRLYSVPVAIHILRFISSSRSSEFFLIKILFTVDNWIFSTFFQFRWLFKTVLLVALSKYMQFNVLQVIYECCVLPKKSLCFIMIVYKN